MTSHDTFAESVAAYAVGALHADERRAFEAHLAGCSRCQMELREMQRVSLGLGLAVEPETPPASLRQRVVAYATSHPQSDRAAASTGSQTMSPPAKPPTASRSTTGVLDRPRSKQPLPSWVPIAIAASIGLAVLTGIYAWALSAQVRSLREMAGSSAAEADRLRDELLIERQESAQVARTLSVMTAADARRITLRGLDDFKAASAQAFWSPTEGLVLNALALPALAPDRIYQLWAVHGTTVASVGVFDVRADGSASMIAPIPSGMTRVDQLAVSLEPAPGVPSRTGPMVLAGQ